MIHVIAYGLIFLGSSISLHLNLAKRDMNLSLNRSQKLEGNFIESNFYQLILIM